MITLARLAVTTGLLRTIRTPACLSQTAARVLAVKNSSLLCVLRTSQLAHLSRKAFNLQTPPPPSNAIEIERVLKILTADGTRKKGAEEKKILSALSGADRKKARKKLKIKRRAMRKEALNTNQERRKLERESQRAKDEAMSQQQHDMSEAKVDGDARRFHTVFQDKLQWQMDLSKPSGGSSEATEHQPAHVLQPVQTVMSNQLMRQFDAIFQSAGGDRAAVQNLPQPVKIDGPKSPDPRSVSTAASERSIWRKDYQSQHQPTKEPAKAFDSTKVDKSDGPPDQETSDRSVARKSHDTRRPSGDRKKDTRRAQRETVLKLPATLKPSKTTSEVKLDGSDAPPTSSTTPVQDSKSQKLAPKVKLDAAPDQDLESQKTALQVKLDGSEALPTAPIAPDQHLEHSQIASKVKLNDLTTPSTSSDAPADPEPQKTEGRVESGLETPSTPSLGGNSDESDTLSTNLDAPDYGLEPQKVTSGGSTGLETPWANTDVWEEDSPDDGIPSAEDVRQQLGVMVNKRKTRKMSEQPIYKPIARRKKRRAWCIT